MSIILLAGSLAVLTSADPIDWCVLDCLGPNNKIEKNTMCTYHSNTEKGNCKNIRDTNTADKRKMILHLHNQYRNAMAGGEKNGWPAAADMKQMTWDNTLEAVALRWAQQCQAGHDDCRRTPEFKIVGQNYGMLGNSAVSPESSVSSFENWVNEISLTNPSIVDKFVGGKWGHFTQVIWATSYKLGCAQVQFTENEQATTWHKTVLICNYGPMGNFVDNPIYIKGDPCTKCPKGWRCIPGSPYPRLCAVPGETSGIPVSGKEPDDRKESAGIISPEGGKEGPGRIDPSASSKPVCLDPILMFLTFFTVK